MSRYLTVFCLSLLGVAFTLQPEAVAMGTSEQEMKVVPGVGITWLETDKRYTSRHISGQEWTEETLALWKQRVESYLAGKQVDSTVAQHLRRFEVSIGMSVEQVRTIWGEPVRKEGGAGITLERWIYSFGGDQAKIELTFHNNSVTRIRKFSTDAP